ncbi:MAG: ABC transporter substrate-binding protein [Gemmiger sp.]
MKKLISVMTAACLAASLAACGSTASSTPASSEAASSAAESVASEATDAQTYKVGICQLVQHVALDAATEGFKDALTEELGDAVSFDEQNAQGDSNTCSTIINGFVSDGVDLILANATPALQAAQAGTDTIPVLGTSVTEYGVALGIDDFDGLVGTNISGTSDLAPLDQQAAMLQELFPDAKTVGLLYCSAEANSQYQVDTVKACLEDMGYTCELYAFSDSNDLASVCQSASDASDVIYVPTDNTVASNTEIINNICLPGGTPVIAGEEGVCSGCGVATLSISYYDLGVATGKMAAKILTGESKIEEMPIEYAPQFTKKYNAANAEALGVTIPEDYVAIEG